jgi:hypothetical protein
VNVAFATPGTQLHKRWIEAHQKQQHLQLDASQPMATAGFAAQK